jgi:DNA-binding MarR family transcriptional regulator
VFNHGLRIIPEDQMTGLFAANPFAENVHLSASSPAMGRPLVACFTADAAAPAMLDRAAAMLGFGCQARAISDLTPDLPFTADLNWILLRDADDLERLEQLVPRIAEEALLLTIDCAEELLDQAWGMLGDDAGINLLCRPTDSDIGAAVAAGMRAAHADRLHDTIDDAHVRQIDQLRSEVERISRMLARLSYEGRTTDGSREPPSPFIEDHVHAASRSYHAGPASDFAGPTVTARDVRQVIRQRRLRDELFEPELFADPAWDMLLDLYAAKLDRSRVSVSSLCIAAAVPATTALRWIKTLTDNGLFERHADMHDARRIFVQLSDGATQAMHRYFARIPELAHLA